MASFSVPFPGTVSQWPHKEYKEDAIWDEVEEDRDVNCANRLVEFPCDPVERSSRLDILALVQNLGMLLEHLVQLVVLQWFQVKRCELKDDFKRNEVNDAELDFGLVHQQVNVNELGEQTDADLQEAKQVWDVRAVPVEQLSLVVRKLHNYETFADLGMKIQVKGHGTGELDQKDVEISGEGEVKLFRIIDNLG